MSDKTGGPAFPTAESNYHNENMRSEGLSIRDYFAAKAMQGMMAYGQCNNMEVGPIAVFAYEYADALLLERAK